MCGMGRETENTSRFGVSIVIPILGLEKITYQVPVVVVVYLVDIEVSGYI